MLRSTPAVLAAPCRGRTTRSSSLPLPLLLLLPLLPPLLLLVPLLSGKSYVKASAWKTDRSRMFL